MNYLLAAVLVLLSLTVFADPELGLPKSEIPIEAQAPSLQDYLKNQCNIIDPDETGTVPAEIVASKSCPIKDNVFCQNGMEQAKSIMEDELVKSKHYTDYVEQIMKIANIVNILGKEYVVRGNVDLVPLVNIFWQESSPLVELEKAENFVYYRLKDEIHTVTLAVPFNAEDSKCDFAGHTIEAN